MKFIFIFFLLISISFLQEIKANTTNIELTKEELNFLENNQPLRFHNEQYWPPYNFNENEIPKGFTVDYATLLAKKLNVKIKYIQGPTWDEFMQMLKKDEIDAIINIAKNKDREKYFNFTTPFHSASNAIYVKKGDEHLDSLKKLEGKTVVMPKGFFAQQFLEKNYPNIKQILVKDSYEALKVLSLGKADATIDKKNVLDYIISTQNISEVVPSNYVEDERLVSHISIGTSKDKPLLNSILNKAQDSVTEEELLALKRKWFGTSDIKNEKSFLSKDEKKYINDKHIIKVCNLTDLKPIEFYENNTFQGINIDLMNFIALKLEIKFEYIKVNNLETAIEFLKNGTCEILPTIKEERKLSDTVLFTNPLESYKLAIVTQKNKPVVQDLDEIINKTMAKKSTSESINLLKSKYPNIDIYETSSDYETLESVNNNRVYYAIEPLPVVAYYMSKFALNDIFISRYTDLLLSTKLAVSKDNWILHNILNKTIEQIKEYEHTTILNKWTNFSLNKSIDYELISKILIVVFIVIAVLAYRQIILNKLNKTLKIVNAQIEEKNRLIAKQKELFEKLYHKSSDGVLLIKNEKITDCNEASLNILKYKEEELLNKYFWDISPKFQINGENSYIKFKDKLDEVLKNGVCSFEWLVLNNNKNSWLEVVLTAIEIDNSPVIHTVIRDINNRKKMEKELECLTNKLEDRIEEEIKKNAEKTNQLIQQSRLAQMGEMISMIAHQWRQPLTAINATTNNLLLKILLDEKMSNKDIKEELQLITDYALHLSSTIDDFRNFFKTDKIKRETNLRDLIEKSINILKTSFEVNNIELILNYEFNENIITYYTELQQVILIILKNAEDVLIEKDIKNKKIYINILKKDDFVLIKIEDNAGGIEESIINKVFDPYFSTKKSKEGTGIGLYMSKIIIDEHCFGNLKVENGLFGAIFTIKLPI